MPPTPPAAPVTSTSPRDGSMPMCSRAITESMAVKPAVPIAIDRFSEIPSGSGNNQSEFSLAFRE